MVDAVTNKRLTVHHAHCNVVLGRQHAWGGWSGGQLNDCCNNYTKYALRENSRMVFASSQCLKAVQVCSDQCECHLPLWVNQTPCVAADTPGGGHWRAGDCRTTSRLSRSFRYYRAQSERELFASNLRLSQLKSNCYELITFERAKSASAGAPGWNDRLTGRRGGRGLRGQWQFMAQSHDTPQSASHWAVNNRQTNKDNHNYFAHSCLLDYPRPLFVHFSRPTHRHLYLSAVVRGQRSIEFLSIY